MFIPRTELLDVAELAQAMEAYGSHVRGWRVEASDTTSAPLVVGTRVGVEAHLRQLMDTLAARHGATRSGPLTARIRGVAQPIRLSAASVDGDPAALDIRVTMSSETLALRVPVAGAGSYSAPAYVPDWSEPALGNGNA